MAVRPPLVAGNWKMNTSIPEGVDLARSVASIPRPAGVEVAVLPPFPHLWPVHDAMAGSGVLLGAQDCFWEVAGARTGEVSPAMLAGWCDLVLVGHSERRALGDTDDTVAAKLRAALDQGLRVILAVGEVAEERSSGRANEVCRRQVEAGLSAVSAADLDRVVIAYEPIWAIGTGVSAGPADAQAMGATIRACVAGLASPAAAARMRVLYGGSMTGANAADLMACPDVDGGLIGGASLRIGEFSAIVAAAATRLVTDAR